MNIKISEIFDDEISNMILGWKFQPIEVSYETELNLAMQIVSEFISRIEKAISQRISIFEEQLLFIGLIKLLENEELNIKPGMIGYIFSSIDSNLEKSKEDTERASNDDRVFRFLSYQKTLEIFAVGYYREQINLAMKEYELPQKLAQIKTKTAESLALRSCSFEHLALLEIEKELEKSFNLQKLESIYRNQLNLSENIKTKSNTKKEDAKFTLRQQVMILMLLTFGRLDKPEDLIQERIVKFFHGITGGDVKKLRGLLKNPTKHNGTKQSIKLLCDDLHFVRDQLGKLGISDNVQKAINEIDYLISELDEEN